MKTQETLIAQSTRPCAVGDVNMLIKVLSNEIVLSSSSNTTVNTAVVVRLVHLGAQEHIITIADGEIGRAHV